MTDYANDDVDRLRIIAKYCDGTEHGVFLSGLADRMEEVVAGVEQPVFTREDVRALVSLQARIEQTLPVEVEAGTNGV